jgi:hypothetical protein
MLKECEVQVKRATEAEAKALLEEQEAKAKEATAALLAELDAEDRQAAAAAEKKKPKKKGNKKKGAGSQQQRASAAAVDAAAGTGVGAEECKADGKGFAPQMEGWQEQQRHRAPQGAADGAAAVAAVCMGNLSLEAENGVGAANSKEGEESVEEEKHNFFFDGAPDGLKCSVGFCLMTEAVVAMDGFSYQKSSLDEHIAHCVAKGQPLTSPLTGEPLVSGMYMPKHNLRTVVKEYIEQREKEWSLHLTERRAARIKTGK